MERDCVLHSAMQSVTLACIVCWMSNPVGLFIHMYDAHSLYIYPLIGSQKHHLYLINIITVKPAVQHIDNLVG